MKLGGQPTTGATDYLGTVLLDAPAVCRMKTSSLHTTLLLTREALVYAIPVPKFCGKITPRGTLNGPTTRSLPRRIGCRDRFVHGLTLCLATGAESVPLVATQFQVNRFFFPKKIESA